MTVSAASSEQVPLVDGAPAAMRAGAGSPAISTRVRHRLEDVEAVWRRLESGGVKSPGQSFDFISLWIRTHNIPEADQVYVVAETAGVPVALLALQRRSSKGIRSLGWFPGAHVGCNAPLVDRPRLATLTPAERHQLWQSMLAGIPDVDVVHLKAVPELHHEGVDLFAELGTSMVTDMLYRAKFSSWEEANATQRSKSRRKHDRQQGEKLAAMGEVSFEELPGSPELLDILFRQRAARFVEMGVADPFCDKAVRNFYDATVKAGSGVDVRLHALRLDGEVVALRYNVVHGDRFFCLISSMSTEPSLQPGSPGKQCLLRVMQTVFDAGARVFDMGAGFTDEKRHWCNVQIPVREHYMALTLLGRIAVGVDRTWQATRKRIKDNRKLLGLIKSLRSKLQKASTAPAGSKPDAED